MKTDYLIEDLVFQNREQVVYRALHKDQTPRALFRFKYSEEILAHLREENRFQKALAQLGEFDHPCLRPVVDGGLDPIDGQPWIAARWWDGEILAESSPTREDIDRIQAQGRDLIASLGDRAGALSFSPSEIVTSHADDGQPVHTFAIDYFQWFRDWAIGYAPGEKNDPLAALAHLISSLVPAPPRTSSPLVFAARTPQSGSNSGPTTAADSGPLSLPIPKVNPLKPVLIISSLLVLIGGGIWWINQRPGPGDSPVTAKVDPPRKPPVTSAPNHLPEPPSEPKPEIPSPAESIGAARTIKPAAMIGPTEEPSPEPTRKTRPESGGEMLDIDADDTDALKENIGEWIVLTGTISEKDGEELQFENSPVRVRLPKDTAVTSPGQKAVITGLLSSETLLEVELPDDLRIIPPTVVLRPIQASGDTYTIKDEAKLRSMGKGTISIQAIVTEYFESNSGKSAYLNLSPKGKTIAVRISKKTAAKNGLDDTALRSLVGKELKITGDLEVERFTERLLIKADKESDWETVGE